MANLFKIAGSDSWHFKARLAPYKFKRVRLCTDKSTSETWGRLLQNATDRKNAGEPPNPEKLAGIPRHCLEKLGLVSKLAEKRRAGWTQTIDEYVGELRTANRSGKYLANARMYLLEIAAACKWNTLQDVDRDDFARFIDKRRADGASARTCNNMTATLRSLVRWAVQARRLDADPLASVKRIDETGDRRRRRRALTDAECAALLKVTEHFGLVYRTALGTGLRLRELRELEWRDVRLDGEDAKRPHLQLREEATKAKRADVLPLTADLADRLRQVRPKFFTPTPRVFAAVPDGYKWLDDLAAAGIEYTDPEGRIVGFHSLRVTFITSLQRARLHPRVIMALARHTDWRLTAGTYTDMSMIDTFGAVLSLPVYPDADREVVWKLGTNDAPAEPDQIPDQMRRSTVQNSSRAFPRAASGDRPGAGKNAVSAPRTSTASPAAVGSRPTRGASSPSRGPRRAFSWDQPVRISRRITRCGKRYAQCKSTTTPHWSASLLTVKGGSGRFSG